MCTQKWMEVVCLMEDSRGRRRKNEKRGRREGNLRLRPDWLRDTHETSKAGRLCDTWPPRVTAPAFFTSFPQVVTRRLRLRRVVMCRRCMSWGRRRNALDHHCQLESIERDLEIRSPPATRIPDWRHDARKRCCQETASAQPMITPRPRCGWGG
ncbi:hypothetical protein VTO42DRAFT_690 [Malbranchea cinnamomea]